MRKALFAGSFNPFTIGHEDIVKRGLELFDEVVIAIGDNQDKPCADISERLQAIRALYSNEPRVHVDVYHSLTADYARKIGACALLRGVRSMIDFEYERQMADANRVLTGIETVVLFTRPELSHISSSLVRDLKRHGADVSAFVRTVCLALVIALGVMPINAQSKSARAERSIVVFNDVLRQLDISYVDTLPYEQMTETAINQMLRQVDPYTVYYPKDKDRELKMMTTGKYGGIGSIIQQRDEKKDSAGKDKKPGKYVIISEPYEGMPAQKAGLLAGDRILEIDGKKMANKTVAEVSDCLRGTPHSTLTIKVQRQGVKDPLKFTVEREEIKLPAVSYYGMLDDGVAYISFSEFTENSANAVQKALDELVTQYGARALVFDLRDNGGGIIDEAVKIVNLFVKKGETVVSTRGRMKQSERIYCTTQDPAYPDMPIVLLVNKNSASASEIVAGSLQDLKRATLVGERTFGKGLVQSVRSVAYDGYVKLTTARYYLPSGRCIQAIDYSKHRGKAEKDTTGGILPDIVISDTTRKVNISYTLYAKQLIYDYATRYRATHPSIASPTQFKLTDADIEDFCRFLDEEQFTYETETSKYFSDMLDMAQHEDLDSATIATLKAIEPQLRPSFREAIQRHKQDVTELLEAEIIERYYYRKGRIEYMLKLDEELKKAQEVIHDKL
ncbi:MAG: pantetheine-phosphate adenylyltransferase [Paludibacteraceae bacterium]|nr:pantetheine-phosphate adenylyltransferase [Paludibacteraceae bacterium]